MHAVIVFAFCPSLRESNYIIALHSFTALCFVIRCCFTSTIQVMNKLLLRGKKQQGDFLGRAFWRIIVGKMHMSLRKQSMALVYRSVPVRVTVCQHALWAWHPDCSMKSSHHSFLYLHMCFSYCDKLKRSVWQRAFNSPAFLILSSNHDLDFPYSTVPV